MARIRSIKPETWQSEQVGQVSHPARLLFVGLITQADDEGRTRGNLALIKSGIYPFDLDLTFDQITAWLAELEQAIGPDGNGLIVRYDVGGYPYIWLPGFIEHQYIQKPRPSKLPACPAAKPAPKPAAKKTAARTGDNDWPDELPSHLVPVAAHVHERLTVLAARKPGADTPNRRRVGLIISDFPDHDHRIIVGKFCDYWGDGKGKGTVRKDLHRTYRDWVGKELPGPNGYAGNGNGAPVNGGPRPSLADRVGAT